MVYSCLRAGTVARSLTLLAAHLLIGAAAEQGEPELIDHLRRVTDRYWGADAARAEQECLKLLAQFPSRASKGTIYGWIAYTYAQSGLHRAGYTARTAEYCEKALEYPVEVNDRIRLYAYWFSALEHDSTKVTGKGFPMARRRAAEVGLRALCEVLKQEMPRSGWDIDVRPWQLGPVLPQRGLDIDMARVREIQEAERAAVQRRVFQEQLVVYKESFVASCVQLYSRSPLNPAEFEQDARRILGDSGLVEVMLRRLQPCAERQLESTARLKAGPADRSTHAAQTRLWRSDGKAGLASQQDLPAGRPSSEPSRTEDGATAERPTSAYFAPLWKALVVAGSASVLLAWAALGFRALRMKAGRDRGAGSQGSS